MGIPFLQVSSKDFCKVKEWFSNSLKAIAQTVYGSHRSNLNISNISTTAGLILSTFKGNVLFGWARLKTFQASSSYYYNYSKGQQMEMAEFQWNSPCSQRNDSRQASFDWNSQKSGTEVPNDYLHTKQSLNQKRRNLKIDPK